MNLDKAARLGFFALELDRPGRAFQVVDARSRGQSFKRPQFLRLKQKLKPAQFLDDCGA